jgi:hypothetical protein
VTPGRAAAVLGAAVGKCVDQPLQHDTCRIPTARRDCCNRVSASGN